MEILAALPLVKHLHRKDGDDEAPDRRHDAGVHRVPAPPAERSRSGRFQRDPQRDWGRVHERPTP